ncbi:MAG: hypothetical protein WCL21_18100, partial [Mariniphaga sp.]
CLAEILPGKGDKKNCAGARIKMAIIGLPGIGIQRNIGVELLSKNQFDDGCSNFSVYSLFGGGVGYSITPKCLNYLKL